MQSVQSNNPQRESITLLGRPNRLRPVFLLLLSLSCVLIQNIGILYRYFFLILIFGSSAYILFIWSIIDCFFVSQTTYKLNRRNHLFVIKSRPACCPCPGEQRDEFPLSMIDKVTRSTYPTQIIDPQSDYQHSRRNHRITIHLTNGKQIKCRSTFQMNEVVAFVAFLRDSQTELQSIPSTSVHTTPPSLSVYTPPAPLYSPAEGGWAYPSVPPYPSPIEPHPNSQLK
ncbi:hypothetical protein BLNAU_1430 [Blattamonas nauphoetae]|uniref:Uncharacterized protein n=1 Tax=Blattamonas nauphoetae TaxID=2049346 RepID=A0ABQ9YI04_9EUKA|nr:hypothetical protein BLNAU_1430 [Blattamonas nauphoetae]